MGHEYLERHTSQFSVLLTHLNANALILSISSICSFAQLPRLITAGFFALNCLGFFVVKFVYLLYLFTSLC